MDVLPTPQANRHPTMAAGVHTVLERKLIMRSLAAFLATCCLFAQHTANATYIYATVDYPGAVGKTTIYGTTGSGEIVGRYQDNSSRVYGYTYASGTFTSIVAPGTGNTIAWGVNDAGQVTGTNGALAFVDTNGSFITIQPTGSTTFASAANDINNNGTVVGSYSVLGEGGTHGYVRSSNGTYTRVDYPGIVNATTITGVNDAGLLVGVYRDSLFVSHGFIDNNGVFASADIPGSTRGTYLNGVNNSGAIVGYWLDDTSLHGFVEVNGQIGTLSVPGSIDTLPFAINDAGQVFGYYHDDVGYHGFIATQEAATAVPEPASMALLGFGVVGVAAVRRRRAP